MTNNGPEGLYIPDQRQVEAEQRAREESDYWRSVAMNREPEEVIKEVDRLSPATFNGMSEAHGRRRRSWKNGSPSRDTTILPRSFRC